MMDKTSPLARAIGRRILILDGAMGTMIQGYQLAEADYRGERFKDWPHDVKGNNDLLSLTRPEIIREIHEKYLDAGADILETNTFNSQRISLADYHMGDLTREMNLAAAKLAREAADKFSTADKPRFVAGILGPTSKTASISPSVSDPGARNISFDDVGRGLHRTDRRLGGWRCRPADGRDHFRHPQRQGCPVCHRAVL